MRNTLIAKAVKSAFALNEQINLLLDGYSFYLERYPANNMTAIFERKDVQVSTSAIKLLPSNIASQIEQWHENIEPAMSKQAFELFVLNELNLHLFSLAKFLMSKDINLDPFEPSVIGSALNVLRDVNRQIESAPEID